MKLKLGNFLENKDPLVLVYLEFVATIISGQTDVDFCPCCVKFIRRDAEGWEVVDPDS